MIGGQESTRTRLYVFGDMERNLVAETATEEAPEGKQMSSWF